MTDGSAPDATARPATSAVAVVVVVVVKVPRPWYAPVALVTWRMRQAVPEYEAVPGLAFMAFSFAQADGDYGGLYLWNDAARARAFFGPAWVQRVRGERGVEPQVRLFEVPMVIDNVPGSTPRDLAASAVGTILTVARPPGADRAHLVQDFRDAIPASRRVSGLLRRHFVLTEDGRYGRIDLWQDEASAQRGLAEGGWPAGDAQVEWFDVPILLPSRRGGDPAIAVAP